MPRILLGYLPFGQIDRPYLGIGLLKAALTQTGIDCDVQYFALDFVRKLGIESYQPFLSNPSVYTILLGEWFFAPARDGYDHVQQTCRDPYLGWVDRRYSKGLKHDQLRVCQLARQHSEAFLVECLEKVDWGAYDIAGFSVGIEQLNASLALAKRLKQRYPHVSVLFGGQECYPPKGAELLRNFPFVDYVCLGEGEAFLPEFVKRVRNETALDDLPGLAYRHDGEVVANPAEHIPDLNKLAAPDYDAFIEQYQTASGRKWRGMLYFESSRGCSWGTKRKCAFCGINPTPYRQKSAHQLTSEIDHLAQRYEPEVLQATDSLAPPDLEELLIGLENRQPPLKLAYCLRADVKKKTLKRLKQEGLNYVNVGIESLSTPILRLMRKGTTALANMQVMKWCRELGIALTWGVMYGIPGEDPAEYERMARLLPLLAHLAPPFSTSRVNLFRESPYFKNPGDFGIANVRPAEPYRYLLPEFTEQSLWNLAYFFDYDFIDGRDPRVYFTPVQLALDGWIKAAPSSILAYVDDGESLRVLDTRPAAKQESFTFTDLERELYLACDEVMSQRRICQQFAASTPNEILDVLDRLVEDNLMVSDGQNYLSLAVDLGQHLPLERRKNTPNSFWLALAKGLYCSGMTEERRS
jgi:ribosomal peptide maturation radical SAM protein 1